MWIPPQMAETYQSPCLAPARQQRLAKFKASPQLSIEGQNHGQVGAQCAVGSISPAGLYQLVSLKGPRWLKLVVGIRRDWLCPSPDQRNFASDVGISGSVPGCGRGDQSIRIAPPFVPTIAGTVETHHTDRGRDESGARRVCAFPERVALRRLLPWLVWASPSFASHAAPARARQFPA